MITTGYRRPWYGERHGDRQTTTSRRSTESRSHSHVIAVRGYPSRVVSVPRRLRRATLPRRRITRSCVRHRQRRALLLRGTAQNDLIAVTIRASALTLVAHGSSLAPPGAPRTGSSGRLSGCGLVPPAGFEPATHGLGRAVSPAHRPANSDYSSPCVAPWSS
jgi:hypothetical protein